MQYTHVRSWIATAMGQLTSEDRADSNALANEGVLNLVGPHTVSKLVSPFM